MAPEALPGSQPRVDIRIIIAGLLGLQTAIAFESFAVSTALPVVAAGLDAPQWFSFAFAATVTTGLIGMTIGGNWVDRSGVRTPLAVGGFLFLLGLVLCVLAPSIGVFVVGRLLQGFGGGIDSVVIYVIIAQSVPEHRRPRVFGLLTTAWLLPATVGPLVTGVLVAQLGWRAVFATVFVASAASLAVLLSSVGHLPRIRTDTAIVGRRGCWAIIAGAGVVGLHLTTLHLTSLDLGTHRPGLGLIVGSAIAFGVIAVAATRLLPHGTLRAATGIPRLVLLRGLLGAGVAATDIYLPLYLQYERNYPPGLAGLVVSLGAFGWVLGAWIQGRSPAEAGHPQILRRATLLVWCGPLSVLGVLSGVAPVAVSAAGCVVMGTGMGLVFPQITSAVFALSPVDHQGTNSSALQLAESLTTSTFLAITGAILIIGGTLGYLFGYLATALVIGTAVGITVLIRPAVGADSG